MHGATIKKSHHSFTEILIPDYSVIKLKVLALRNIKSLPNSTIRTRPAGNNPDSYSVGPNFNHGPGNRLTWLRIVVVLLSYPLQISE